MIPASFTKKTSGYIEQMARAKKVLGRDVFFGFDVIPDPRNTSNNIMLIDTPITSSPFPKYNLESCFVSLFHSMNVPLIYQ